MFFCEETYSLVLLKEMDLLCKSRLYATDISTKALDKSKKESTLLMTLKNIPLITFHVGKESNQYFVSDGQKSIISSDLKKDIFFSRHNLVTDGVFKECHFILCRNVLIYFNEDFKIKFRAFFIKVYQYMVFCLEIRRRL
jgi:chemotaxis protein methyltransferase CheR